MKNRQCLILVGLMGAGKTTIGKALARKSGWRFADSDHEIESRTGVRIPTIFEIEGERGFRQRESRVLEELLSEDKIVLATGGGAVLSPENRLLMRQSGVVCYLRATPRTLHHRTRRDRNRPLLQVKDPLRVLTALAGERGPLYEEVADVIVDVEGSSSEQIVEQLSQQEPFV